MKKLIGHNSNELTNGTVEALDIINSFLKENTNFKLKGDVNIEDTDLLRSKISDLGICDRRRLKRAINKVALKASLFSYNRFLWFLNKIVLSGPDTVKITEPKHETIQVCRKKWKEAQKIADELHSQYIDEKGDYYK